MIQGTDATVVGALVLGLQSTGRWLEAVGEAAAGPALVLALALLAALAWRLRRPQPDGGPAHLLLALGAAWCAQATLASGAVAARVLLLGAACAGWALRRPAPRPLRVDPRHRSLALAAAALLLVVYGVVALHQIGSFPDLYFDEVAYLRAANMHAGRIPHGPVLVENGVEIYNLAQFRAQPIPLWLHRLALVGPDAGVAALRVASVVSVGAALALAALTLLRGLGGAGVVWTLLLATFSPLLLTYARTGQYLAVTLLHGTLCLAALAHLLRRGSVPAALWLGGLLGASLYCYQLSWFTPLIVGACAASVRGLWTRPGALRLAGITVAAALLVALPGLSLVDELRAVTAQTFDRAVWNRIQPGGERAALVVLPRGAAAADVARAAALLEAASLDAAAARSGSSRPVLAVSGSATALEAGASLAAQQGWDVVRDPWQEDRVAARLGAAVAQLFVGPLPESAGRWIDGALLGPLLAPLGLLGLIEAFRRRRETLPRLLLVWVPLAALVPAVVGGVVPRRTLLALPWLYGLMALPLLEVGAALASKGGGGRLAARGAGLLLALAIAASGSHAYFERWDQRIGVPSHERGVLAFLDVVSGLPADEVVLYPSFYSRNQQVLLREPRPAGTPVTVMVPQAVSAEDVRAASCARPTPFVWLTLDEPDQTARFAELGEDFLFRTETRRGFAIYRVSLRKPDGCRGARGGAPP